MQFTFENAFPSSLKWNNGLTIVAVTADEFENDKDSETN